MRGLFVRRPPRPHPINASIMGTRAYFGSNFSLMRTRASPKPLILQYK